LARLAEFAIREATIVKRFGSLTGGKLCLKDCIAQGLNGNFERTISVRTDAGLERLQSSRANWNTWLPKAVRAGAHRKDEKPNGS
jgi:hypothetical protein